MHPAELIQLNGQSLADMYGKKECGKSVALVTLLPFLGPALGPIHGGLVTRALHCFWVFWIMSALNALILVLRFFLMRESYTQGFRLRQHGQGPQG